MKKYLLFTTYFLSLFLHQNLNAQNLITNSGMTFTPDTLVTTINYSNSGYCSFLASG